MTFASADILGRHLRPHCSRDNHAMKYESSGSASNNAGTQAAYHCGFMGCSVRYNLVDGYYMLIGMPDHANPVDEPGVNTRTCPRHGCWLYRRENVTAKPDRKSTRLNSSHTVISYAVFCLKKKKKKKIKAVSC